MEQIAYVVAEKAGPKVANRPVAPGEELLLTEFEARTELLAGSLRPKAVEPAAASEAPADGAERPLKKR